MSVILVVVGALVAGSALSASAATVSPDKWAPKFCKALSGWQDTISQKGSSLESALGTAPTSSSKDVSGELSSARTKIVNFLGQMVTATDKATASIKSAGTPSSPNGAKIEAVFVNGFKAISKEFAKAQAQAKSLPTDTAAKFKAKGVALGQTISDSADKLGSGFSSVDQLDSGKDLQNAVTSEPSCAFLSSGSSTTTAGS